MKSQPPYTLLFGEAADSIAENIFFDYQNIAGYTEIWSSRFDDRHFLVSETAEVCL